MFALFNTLGRGWSELVPFFEYCACFAAAVYLRKLYVQQKNAANSKLQAKVQQARQSLGQAMRDYEQSVMPWLPSEFANLEAVGYFRRVVGYGQAYTLGDAITLYEQYRYRNNIQQITSSIYDEVASLNSFLGNY